MNVSIDDDLETSRLIAQLMLEDIEEFERFHRGRVTGGAVPTVEDIPFRSQVEGYRLASQIVEDRALAKSIDSALEIDQPPLDHHQRVEQADDDDRETALKLPNEMALPTTKTEPQPAVESVSLPPEPEHSQPKAERGGIATSTLVVVSSASSSSAPLQSAMTSQLRSKGQSSTNLNVSDARGDSTKDELIFLLSFLLLSLFI